MKEYTDEALREDGFDGLYNPGECGCEIGDLAPCGGQSVECKPGYRLPDPREGYKGDWAIWGSKDIQEEDWSRIHY